jgi:general secretion pathway protein G|tara:strand:+ start:1301 stop:1702 length:402 start_codon:yes stop_codon:yes gene_type:complete
VKGIKNKQRHRQFGISIYQLLVLFVTLSIIVIVFINNYETMDTQLTAQENVLRHELIVMRSAIIQYHSVMNTYPHSIEQLVDTGYLRDIPVDPITNSHETWELIKHAETDDVISDVRSGSRLMSSKGTPYSDW